MKQTFYNHLDENGNTVEEKVILGPLRPEIPSNHSYVPYVEPTQFIKNRLVEEVKSIRDRKLIKGGFKVNDKWFHSDTFSRSQQLGLTIIGGGLPNNIDWKTMDGTKVRLTPPMIQQLFANAMAQDNTLFAYAEGMIAAIQASPTPEGVDLEAGWPETYQGA